MPRNAIVAPIDWTSLGFSPSTAQARKMVMNACNWMTSEASPTGMPMPIDRNSRPNCPTPINRP
jgi:hypothetical protein